MRDQLEQPYWQQFEQQRKESRERFAREEELREARERETTQQKKRQQKKAKQQREPQPKRQDVKLPRTVEEALAALHLARPVMTSDVKRAYRAQAFHAHPDHGGSHAAMVRINAAYELALAAC